MRSAVLQNTAATHATNMSSRPRLDYDEHDNFVEQHKRSNPAHNASETAAAAAAEEARRAAEEEAASHRTAEPELEAEERRNAGAKQRRWERRRAKRVQREKKEAEEQTQAKRAQREQKEAAEQAQELAAQELAQARAQARAVKGTWRPGAAAGARCAFRTRPRRPTDKTTKTKTAQNERRRLEIASAKLARMDRNHPQFVFPDDGAGSKTLCR